MKIVYEATRNYYPYLRGAIASLLDHNDPEVVYVLAEDDHIDKLPECCTVINISDQQWISHSSPNWKTMFSWVVLIRVCYPELLPCDKVLQLDVDTIVCDSLEPAWNTDLTGKWFAAVPEYKTQYRPFGDIYYNCGVILFNLEQMRRDNIMPDLVWELNKFFYPFPEQDVLNGYAIEYNKHMALPVRFNESPCCGMTEDPAVVHFAGEPDWMTKRYMVRREYLDPYRPHHAE